MNAPAWLVWLLGAGAPASDVAPPPPPSLAPPAVSSPASAPAPSTEKRQVKRADVDAVYEKGAQRLIAGLEVDGARQGRKFLGFRIVRIRPDGPLHALQALRPGDIVRDVNGYALERPDQFMRAWGALREATVIRVSILRGAEPLTLEWDVVP